MSKSNFALNLRSLCDRHVSVAQVCRSLEINRQQFNKYLSGQIYPSKFNLNRICDFFKMSEDQLQLNQSSFNNLPVSAGDTQKKSGSSRKERVVNGIPSDLEALSRYEGYYYNHSHSPGFPGKIVRSLTHIFRDQDMFYSKTIEHLWDKGSRQSQHHRFKYDGIVIYVGERIFITEYERLTGQNICHTILFPSYRNAIDSLSGLACGVGSLNSHQPFAMRVELKFLGKNVDARATLEGCGLFTLDSEAIDQHIKDRIQTEILPHEYMLTARDR